MRGNSWISKKFVRENSLCVREVRCGGRGELKGQFKNIFNGPNLASLKTNHPVSIPRCQNISYLIMVVVSSKAD